MSIRPLLDRTVIRVPMADGGQQLLFLDLARARRSFPDRKDGKIYRSTLQRHRREILFLVRDQWILEQRCVRRLFHVWTPPSYNLITDEQAVMWLCVQGWDSHPNFPKESREAAAAFSLGLEYVPRDTGKG